MVGKLLPITPSRWSIVLIRVIAVLLGVVVIIAAGLGIAYALKKKNILLLVTTTTDEGTESTKEIRLKRDKDGADIFNGTFHDSPITLRKGHYEGREMWLLEHNGSVGAIHEVKGGGVFSFLAYDPPAGDEWTTLSEVNPPSVSHSWY